ncbi:Phage tail-collar fibre protein [Cohaesibacter sp. ES.047]|uniref:phage tail protein n=1 Tax=Cohaesibacter sp. ES.047 TaxID=1798205 RepID=UPI000BB7CDB3|nr:phage tail protein [Cohaesibacter sp. ES.047]SNY91399.1 Phage tail-collar fibre protein [Cohaesibacter sp. ES.047]
MTTYSTRLTNAGAIALNEAITGDTAIALDVLAVGDANGADYVPDGSEAALINEQYRLPLASIIPHPVNADWLVLEAILPPDVGGWWIREVGIYDDNGDLFAIANFPPTYKAVAVDGATSSLTIQIVLQVSDSNALTLSVDAQEGYATQSFVEAGLSGKADNDHTHDDRYYTETEIDTKLIAKAPASHSHDNLYYTEAEIDAKLAGKAATSHTHDGRYYTETEMDSKLAGKAAASHTHPVGQISGINGNFDLANGLFGGKSPSELTGIFAWVSFNGASGAVLGSSGVSSVTKNGTGDFTVNFSAAAASTGYAVVALAGRTGTDGNINAALWPGSSKSMWGVRLSIQVSSNAVRENTAIVDVLIIGG